MKNLIVACFVIVLLFPARLYSQSKEQELVIASFEKLLKVHFDSYKTNKRKVVTMLGGGWVTEYYELDGKYSYDIQKTSSIISPYIGYCTFALKEYFTDFHSTKEEAKQDTIIIRTGSINHKHYYEYKKGKWFVYKREHEGFESWYDCNEIITTGENNGSKDISGCWEKNISYSEK